MKKQTPNRNERGAAAVEFAVILPLLLLVVFGGIEFGLVLFNKQVLTNASREATRAGIVAEDEDGYRVSETDMETIVDNYCLNYLVTFDPTDPDPTVSFAYEDPGNQAFGTDLTVTVAYDYEFLLVPNLRSLFGGSASSDLTITAVTTMRYE